MSAWLEAAESIQELLSPEMRYRTPWGGDELVEAVQDARRWLSGHPCPDRSIGRHLTAMLEAYAEMPHATVSRVMELREIIGEHVHAVGGRKFPRSATSSTGQ
jgi:hypothetical protein